MDEEIHRFELKVEAGAEYAVTQPVFDLDLLEAFLKRIEHFKIPVICGIWPLTSFRNAEFMVNELRVPVPETSWSECEGGQRRKGARRGRRHRAGDGRRGWADGAGRAVERSFRPVPDGHRSGRSHRSR